MQLKTLLSLLFLPLIVLLHGAVNKLDNIDVSTTNIKSATSSDYNYNTSLDSIYTNTQNNKVSVYSKEKYSNIHVAPGEWVGSLKGALNVIKTYTSLSNELGLDNYLITDDEFREIQKKKEEMNLKLASYLDEADSYKLEFTGDFAKEVDLKDDFLSVYNEENKNTEYLNEKEFKKYVIYDLTLNDELLRKEKHLNSNIKAYNIVIEEYTNLFTSQNVKSEMIPEVILKTAKGEYVIWDNFRTPDGIEPSTGKICERNCGHYLANRDRSYGKDSHYGEDILSNAGDLVFSPVAGKLIEADRPYQNVYY